jgi:PAS domain-containing protein
VTVDNIGGELFRALLEAAPDAMVIVDRDGRIALVNAQTEKLFRYTRGALLGKPVEVLPGASSACTRDTARRTPRIRAFGRWASGWSSTACARTARNSPLRSV